MSESKAQRVEIRDMDGETLSILVDYIYTSEIEVSEDNVQVLLPAASLLQLLDVRQVCCEFLQAQLHPSNCLGIRAFADLHTCNRAAQPGPRVCRVSSCPSPHLQNGRCPSTHLHTGSHPSLTIYAVCVLQSSISLRSCWVKSSWL
uniref:BTB domain-containing protein n=1 Tax=Denticeps clupeoides TaxID=299321 RepID=A0AAY4E7W8_9TELE